jgi:hypothetical protein
MTFLLKKAKAKIKNGGELSREEAIALVLTNQSEVNVRS